jgi:hypothetical protein
MLLLIIIMMLTVCTILAYTLQMVAAYYEICAEVTILAMHALVHLLPYKKPYIY